MSHVVGIGILAVFLASSLGGLECTHDDGFGIEDVMESDHITAALVHLGKGEKPVAVGVELLEELHALALIFRQFDPNGNGLLSLAEVDKGCRDVIGLHDIFDAKPVIMRAFQAAKKAGKEHSKHANPDFVTKPEFRLLLSYLHQYLELWRMFTEIENPNEHRISIVHFTQAWPKISAWGVTGTPEENFRQIDSNGGGEILFIEFTDWALAKHLDHEE